MVFEHLPCHSNPFCYSSASKNSKHKISGINQKGKTKNREHREHEQKKTSDFHSLNQERNTKRYVPIRMDIRTRKITNSSIHPLSIKAKNTTHTCLRGRRTHTLAHCLSIHTPHREHTQQLYLSHMEHPLLTHTQARLSTRGHTHCLPSSPYT